MGNEQSTPARRGGAIDAVPVISQFKSLVQVIGGDEEGARATQENFSRRCPVVSQMRSLGEAISGDPAAAKRTQEEFWDSFKRFLESIPGVGHIMGGVYYVVLDDSDKGKRAMLAASRTTVVIGASVGGIFAGGPVGAVVGGVAAGVAYDRVATEVLSGTNDEFTPNGNLENLTNVVNNPKDPGGYLELIFLPVVDGSSAMFTAKVVQGAAKNAGAASKAVKGGTPGVAADAIYDFVQAQLERLPNMVKKVLVNLWDRVTKYLMNKVRCALKEFEQAIRNSTQDQDKERTMFLESDQSVKELMEHVEASSGYRSMMESQQKELKEAVLLLANLDEDQREELLQCLCKMELP